MQIFRVFLKSWGSRGMIKKLFSNLYFSYSLVFVFTLFGIYVGYQLGYQRSLELIDRKVLEEINKLNSTVPIMVDNETQLDSVFLTSDSKTIVYRFSIVNYDREDLIEANATARMQKMARRSGCMNSQLSFILDYGYSASLEYSDNAGLSIFTTTLSKQDCDEILKQPEEKTSSDIFEQSIEDQIRESLEPEAGSEN